MNKYKRFFTAFNILFLLFMRSVSIIKIMLFSYVFDVFIERRKCIYTFLYVNKGKRWFLDISVCYNCNWCRTISPSTM